MSEAGAAFGLLFSEYRLGELTLRSRLVGLPHGTARIRNGIPDDDDLAYWEARALGGAAMLTVGGSIVHPTTALLNRWLNEVYNPAAFSQLERRAELVHKHGTRIITQLVHLGREGIGGESDYALVAPSALRSPRTPIIPHPLSRDEVKELVESFIQSSVNLRDLGYDGVEIHAAHGYLVAQFLSPDANRREDEYGGDVAGRTRFLEEVIAGVRARCGAAFLLGVRLTAEEEYPAGMHIDETLAIVRRLADVAPPDYLSITHGMRGFYVKDVTEPLGVAVASAAAVKAAVSLPVLVGNRIVGPAMGEEILRRGDADLIGTARGFVADPQLARKGAGGDPLSIRPCLYVNQECRTFPGGILCSANPQTGRERWYAERLAEPRRPKQRLLVVGGGPAGLEAARFAAELGNEVVLVEKAVELGGQMRLMAAVASRAGVFALIPHLEHEARRLGVEIRLGNEADAASLKDDKADAIILATGARAVEPDYPHDADATIVTVWDVLGGELPAGRTALIMDDGSGSWESVSAAELLADQGLEVHLATPAPSIGGAIPFESIVYLLRRLGERRVTFHEHSRIAHVGRGRVKLTDALTALETVIEADFVAGYAGSVAASELAAALEGSARRFRTIGDCVSPRRIGQAQFEADKTVLDLVTQTARLEMAARAW